MQSWAWTTCEETQKGLGHITPDTPGPLFFFFYASHCNVQHTVGGDCLNSKSSDTSSFFIFQCHLLLSQGPDSNPHHLRTDTSLQPSCQQLCLTHNLIALLYAIKTWSFLLTFFSSIDSFQSHPKYLSTLRQWKQAVIFLNSNNWRPLRGCSSPPPLCHPDRACNKSNPKEKQALTFLPLLSTSPPTNKWYAFSALTVLGLC